MATQQRLFIDTEVRGEICGGFSDIPWDKTNSKAQYIAIEKKFPFHQILTNQDLSPIKFDIMKKFYLLSAIQRPIFGAGADLLIASNCNVNKESYSNHLPHSYDGDHAFNQLLMGNYYFSIIDYEVFTSSHPAPKSNH